MSSERHQLLVTQREVLGSAESRRLRRRGIIPGILYGRERPVAISIPERDLRAALTTKGGLNAVLDVVVDDASKAHPSVLKEFQRDLVRGAITHVDLQEVRLDQAIHATVPVTLVGEAVGVKEGGILSQVTVEVNVEALPMEVPQHLDLDISALAIGDSARLDALTSPRRHPARRSGHRARGGQPRDPRRGADEVDAPPRARPSLAKSRPPSRSRRASDGDAED